MTNVRIKSDKGYAKIIIKGHAGYGMMNHLPEGHDIVCAAISMLGQTLVQRLMDMSDERKVIIHNLRYEPGEINIRVLAKRGNRDELENTIKTVETGMMLIQEQYPDYIKVGVLDSAEDI